MKNLLKVLFFIALGFAILYFMNARGLLNVSSVFSAFAVGRQWVMLVFAVQFVQIISMLMRYRFLVRLFGIDVPFSQVSAATFVSTAVGQWAPGALAVTEVIRVGLMIGADKQKGMAHNGGLASLAVNAHQTSSTASPSATASTSQPERPQVPASTPGSFPVQGVRTRLAVASLFDRLLGFFTILSAGSVASGGLFASQVFQAGSPPPHPALAMLFGFSFCGALFIGSLPFLSRWRVVTNLLVVLQNTCARKHVKKTGTMQSFWRICEKISRQLHATQTAIAEGSRHLHAFLTPVLFSTVSLVTSSLSLYFASHATGETIGVFATLAAFPVIAISQLLPIGFGGMGGYQLVAVAVFGVFGMNAASVSSASLLQNGLFLMQNTLLGLLFAHLSASQIRAILQARKVAA